jgi:hypothetical protein
MDLQTRSDKPPSFFDQRPRLLLVSLIGLFALAGIARLYRINAPGILIDREFTSAMFARAFFLQQNDTVETWRREIALLTYQNQPTLEPPVTEYLVSLLYQVTGEKLAVAHLLTSLFWLIGGIFFYRAANMMVSADAAVLATAYYLLTPLGILTSRSFQADSLMMMLFMLSLWGIMRHIDRPTKSSLYLAGIFSGLAILYRPLVLFGIMGAFTALTLHRQKRWQSLFGREFLLFALISLLPAVAYYGYGMVFAGYLRWKVGTSFHAYLYFRREYWEGWLELAVTGMGYLAIVGALLGLVILKGRTSAALLGLWGGYLVFGLLFNMHIHTHGYYHAQLIPTVALSFSPLAVILLQSLRASTRAWWVPVILVGLLIGYYNVRTVRDSLGVQAFEDPQTARKIGELVHHSSRIVFLARYYGIPLQYFGEFTGTYWPRKTGLWAYLEENPREYSVQERFAKLGFAPEYIVITDFAEFENHHEDFQTFLTENCALIAQTQWYLIYDGACATANSN